MSLVFLGLAFLLAVCHWFIVYKNWYKAELFFKPAVMLALFFALLAASPRLDDGLALFAAAIIFSLLGDVLLLFPSRFNLGLAMFLLAHIFYILAFNLPVLVPHPFIFLLAVFIFIPAAWLYRRIQTGLLEKGLRRLRPPVLAYLIILSMMLLSGLASLFRSDWPLPAALLVAGGAILFATSDGLLAWNKFVRPLRTRRVGYMIAYHLAQVAILVGALWRYGHF
jgi:uncharacterized membrane protein YhhN